MKQKGQDHGPATVVAVQPGAGILLPAPAQPGAGAPAGYGYPYDQAGQHLTSQNTTVQGQNRNNGSNVGKATSKAGAYGGSELGSLLGGAVGPPIIGGIIGNLVGERVGEKAVKDTGFDGAVSKAGDELSKVIGRERVEKIPEITMTALGYSEHEECICCPCLTASQVMLFLAIPFFFFNFYKLGIGISYDSSCSNEPPPEDYVYNSTDNITDIFPCEYGYDYLVVSSAVWLAILPFWICGLFGNCWRQCCCCCCDPIVLLSTAFDLLKKCCCECGDFKLCEILWIIHCAFHLIISGLAFFWLLSLNIDVEFLHAPFKVKGWLIPKNLIDTVIVSIILDTILAGSELSHRLRLKYRKMMGNAAVEATEMNPMNPPPNPAAYNTHQTNPPQNQGY